jgi:hypothetical protein
MNQYVVKQFTSATAELAVKIRLENMFKRTLTSLFAAMSRDFTSSVRAVGRAPEAEVYEPGFSASLMQQYTRTQKAFKGQALNVSMSEAQVALSGLALMEWRRTQTTQQSSIITDTNTRQMDESLALGRQSLAEDDIEPTPNSLARVSTAILINRFLRSRVNVIAETETQAAAESTKLIDAEAVAGKRPFPLRDTIIEPQLEKQDVSKSWNTIGDSRVRPSHVATNGVILATDGVFNVGGSQLRFPGDTGLGASFRELVNCRCSSIYNLGKTQ